MPSGTKYPDHMQLVFGGIYPFRHMVRAFTHGAMGHQINPSSGGPIELFLIPASSPRLV